MGIEFTFLGSLLTVPTFNFNVLVNKMRNSFSQGEKKKKGEISRLNDTWVWCYAAQFSEPLHRSARWLEMSLSVCFSSRKAVYSAECEESLSPLRPLLLTPPKAPAAESRNWSKCFCELRDLVSVNLVRLLLSAGQPRLLPQDVNCQFA